jgi:hypothetical protein
MGTPMGELRRQAEPAGRRKAGNQRHVGRNERPSLAEILRHTVPPHVHPLPCSPGRLRGRLDGRHATWPFRTASRSLGQRGFA